MNIFILSFLNQSLKLRIKYAHVSYFLILLTMLLSKNATSQVAANFTTVSNNTGCGSLVVQFQDLSTGNPDTWLWDFGNGNISTQQNPIAIYSSSGSFDVTLTVSNNNSNDAKTSLSFIEIFELPVAEISTNSLANGCAPLDIVYQDASVFNNPIISWQWDFGDGGGSQLQNPTYTYQTSGSYNVSLLIVDSNGCQNMIISNNYINVDDTPESGFLSNNNLSCDSSAFINFINTSVNADNYFWDFGDGFSSTLQNPVHNYTTGIYSVSLVATNGLCQDTFRMNDYIEIGATINPIFSSNLNSVCEGIEVNFTDLTNHNVNQWIWDFGDGSISTQQNPSHIYSDTGNFDITLTTSISGECANTRSVNSFIEVFSKPSIRMFADTTYSCSAPFVVQFTDSTLFASNWRWDFSNGATSNLKDPIISFDSIGLYNVSLVVENFNGCIDTVDYLNFIIIDNIDLDFSVSDSSVCNPSFIEFFDHSQSTRPLVYWQWDFGDGNTSILNNPIHEYVNSGLYNISLTAINDYGCESTRLFSDMIKVIDPPLSNFQAQPNPNCVGQDVNFVDLSSSTLQINNWSWDFGDGFTSQQQNPIHQYQINGIFDVSLIASIDGCSDTLVLYDYITIKEPTAIYNEQYSCNDSLSVDFTNLSIGADSIFWDFGDGTFSNQISPYHTFPNQGVFDVRLQVFNNLTGCTHEFTKQINITLPKANFTYLVNANNSLEDSIGCRPKRVYLQNLSQNFSYYKVIWEDGYIGYGRTDHLFDTVGSFDVSMIVTDFKGCKDTFSINNMFRITDVEADFTISNVLGCDSMLVTFQDLTSSPSTVKWDFGDGGSSIQNNPQNIYYNEGYYDVSLYVLSNEGCKDTLTKLEYIQFQYPVSNFYSDSLALCPNETTKFISNSDGISLSQFWDFGDGYSSNLQNPSHTYSSNGLYNVTLTVIDSFGCSNIMTRNNYIRVEKPSASYQVIGSTSNCPPLISSFSNQSSSDVVSWMWDFGDGSSSFLENPSHVYSNSGNYNVSLIVSNDLNCFDTLTVNDLIVISGPSGVFYISDTIICKNEQVVFSPFSTNTDYYFWDFGDGSFSNDSIATHNYASSGNFTPSLVMSDSLGCQFTLTSESSIHVTNLDLNVITNQFICLGDSVQLQAFGTGSSYSWYPNINISNPTVSNPFVNPDSSTVYYITNTDGMCLSEDSILVTVYQEVPNPSFTTFNHCEGDLTLFNGSSGLLNSNISWDWSFGSQNPNPSYQLSVGSQLISLTVKNNDNGCLDSIGYIITIFPSPEASFYANEVCLGDSTIFINTSSPSNNWSWDFGDGLANYLSSNPNHLYSQKGSYNVILEIVDSNGCKNVAENQIIINDIPYADFTSEDVCKGEFSFFNDISIANDDSLISWIWNFGDMYSNGYSKNDSNLFLKHGEHIVSLKVYNNKGCHSSVKKSITVYENPESKFDYSNFCINDMINFIDLSKLNNGNIVMWNWDFGDGIGGASHQHPSYMYEEPGTYQVSLTTTSNFGCVNQKFIDVIIYDLPKIEFSFDDSLCLNQEVKFLNNSYSVDSEILSWKWNFGDGFYSNNMNPNHTYSSIGIFDVTLEAITREGCRNVSFIDNAITIIPSPVTSFFTNKSILSQSNPIVEFYNTSTEGDYLWDFGNGHQSIDDNPLFTFQDTGLYIVTLITKNNLGCSSIAQEEIYIYKQLEVYIPNSFTPNNDGLNDVFLPEMTGVKEFRMTIIDRWGGVIYISNDLSQGWDGRSNDGKRIIEGTYAYNIIIDDVNDKRFIYNGMINLMK